MPFLHPDAVPEKDVAYARLSRDWLISAGIALAAIVGMIQLLLSQWVAETVGRWAILTGLAIFYELRIFKQTLSLMHHPGEETLTPGVSLVGWLTILAGLGYALLAGFLLVTPPEGALAWLPSGLAACALAADGLAVLLSRRRKQKTVGDVHLAREFRALGMLIITALAIHYGKLPAWLLIIGIMDYLHLFTGSWLERQEKSLQPPPAQPRRFLQSLYMIAIGVSLWPAVPSRYAAILSLLFGLPYFLIALRDWFILAGLLDPDQSHYRQATEAVNRALTGWLALSIRLLAAMATATVAADMIFHFDLYAGAFSDALYAGGVALMLFVALPFLFVGVRVRIFGLIAFAALFIILLVMGQNTVILAGLLLLGLGIILGPGNLAVEKENPPQQPPPLHPEH